MNREDTVIQFPRPTVQGATRWQIFRTHVSLAAGKVLRWLGVPGAVRNTEIVDDLTGQRINIRVGVLFTRISVNDRDYYFRRLGGRFDGTGSGCGCG